jgi:hypothetical protein
MKALAALSMERIMAAPVTPMAAQFEETFP